MDFGSGEGPVEGLFLRAILCRCPRCGEGKLFDGFLKFRDKCTSCGLGFDNFDTGDGPAFFVNAILCVVAGVMSLMLELNGGVSWYVHLVIWLVVVGGLTLLLLRPVKSLFVGLQNKFNTP